MSKGTPRSEYMSATQKAQMGNVRHRWHVTCLALTGVARPGKTRQDKARRGDG